METGFLGYGELLDPQQCSDLAFFLLHFILKQGQAPTDQRSTFINTHATTASQVALVLLSSVHQVKRFSGVEEKHM